MIQSHDNVFHILKCRGVDNMYSELFSDVEQVLLFPIGVFPVYVTIIVT